MSTYAIQRTRIIGTQLYTYTAWETDDEHCQHSTIRHIVDERYGQVSSRRLPSYIEAIPVASDARCAAVRAWQAQLDATEHRLIYAAFPEATTGAARAISGGIEMQCDPALPALPNARRYYTEPPCPGLITSRQRAYEVACWLNEALAEGERSTLNTLTITRRDDRLIVAGRPGHWTPAELADLIFWPERKAINHALRTYYIPSGATR